MGTKNKVVAKNNRDKWYSHEDNRVKQRNWVKSRKRKIKDFVAGLPKEKCIICGYSKCKYSLHYHHLDPKEKNFTISLAPTKGISIKRIQKELEKCVVLCANCHGEVTSNLIKL